MKTIVFLLTAHSAEDERVRYHQLPSLVEAGWTAYIVAPSQGELPGSNPYARLYDAHTMTRRQCVNHCVEMLRELKPDVVLADTPMALWMAVRYRRSSKRAVAVLYDVTEWYPSKKNLRFLTGIAKGLKFCAMVLFNAFVNLFTDGFVFGEVDKARPFRRLFPHRPFVMTSYYPDLKYITTFPAESLRQQVRLFYSGNLTDEKGFGNVLKAAVWVARFNPETQVVLNVLSNQRLEKTPSLPANLSLQIDEYQPFAEFCRRAAQNDVFLDLRIPDDENQKCLPIKLFYFMAMGRPVVYTDLKAIHKGCPEFEDFGSYVNPFDTQQIVDVVNDYIRNAETYGKCCEAALRWAKEKYNWKSIEADFVSFIQQYEQH